MAPAPIHGSGAGKLKQPVRAERVALGPNVGNNAREWRVRPRLTGGRPCSRPVIGAFHPYEVGLPWFMPAQTALLSATADVQQTLHHTMQPLSRDEVARG